MAAMDFRSWALESYTPVVMVVASPAAEAAVQSKNGLTVADMLRPSGYFHHLSGALHVDPVASALFPARCVRGPGLRRRRTINPR
jgi:hypothetical protein